jgi:hypothetical protein
MMSSHLKIIMFIKSKAIELRAKFMPQLTFNFTTFKLSTNTTLGSF